MKYTAVVNGKRYEVEIERATSVNRSHHQTMSMSTPAPTTAASATVPTSEPKGPTPQAGGGAILSPMPGSVLDVLVNPGDSVADGQTVAMLEAMKMEIEVKADKVGVVSSIPVKKGDTVESGTMLVLLKG